MKRKYIANIGYILGIMLILYPLVSKYIAFVNQTEVIEKYKEEIKNIDEDELNTLKENSEKFNTENSTEVKVIDSNSIEEEVKEESVYNYLDTGTKFGLVTIPKLNLELPLYEGVTVDNLQMGISHMSETSLPNGQKGTHSVLAGHTGVPGILLLDNLDMVSIGDEFYITFLDEVSKYEVIVTRVVLPDETESLRINEEECLVTLVTCTPRTINTHRLLVTGKKVEMPTIVTEEGEEIVEEIVVPEIQQSKLDFFIIFIKKNLRLVIWVIVILIIFIILAILDSMRNNKKKEDKKEK